MVLVTGTVVYGKGDEQEIAEEIAEGHFSADVEEAAQRRLPAAGSSSAVAVPAPAAAAGSSEAASSQPVAMGASYGSLKSTQNIGAFSGSLSRSLVRHRMGTPPPRVFAP